MSTRTLKHLGITLALGACAMAVLSLLNDRTLEEPSWMNTCYSLITPSHGISVAGIYKLDADKNLISVEGAGGTSPQANASFAQREAGFALSGYQNLVSNTFY